METAASPSGEQWTIRHGEHEAVVVEVGGGLRSYTHAGRDVVHGYAVDEQCSGGRGQLLMPWPNRVRDGRYSFEEGKELQLALTEPPRHHAIHGLVRWSLWSVADRSDASLTVACRLRPQQGWSWSLDLTVGYLLDDEGLTVTPHARNVGMTPAPFGFGAHPYLTATEARVDELTLTVPAVTSVDVDERLIPCGTSPLEGTELDYRGGRPIGNAVLDNAFTDLEADSDGRWRVSIERPAGGDGTDVKTTLWADAAAYPWAQVFTGDTLSEPLRRTSGVAVEPMTCPADALNSGTGLLTLKPGAEFSASWGITPAAAS
jgi:aldose 1-epimerase